MSEMSFEDAVQAIEGAAAQDAGEASPAPVEPVVDQAPPESPDSPGETPEVEGTTEAPAETPDAPDTFAQKFDPNALPPELQDGYRLMQADYTRTKQALAEERKQFEALTALGDPEELSAAHELYTSLQDPSTWPELHAALTAQMEAQGLSPAEAAAAATAAIQEEAAAAPTVQLPESLEALVKEDPELTPLAEGMRALQAELSQLKQEQAQRAQAEREEQINAAMLGEISRQEAVLRSKNPSYTDEDIDFIAAHSAYHDGNLLEAEKSLENYFNGRFRRMMEMKETVPVAPPTPVAPPPVEAPNPSGEYDPFHNPLDEATRQAVHDLNSIESLENGL